MGETEQIVRHIHEQREELGRKVSELQSRVKEEIDWRVHFNRHPWAFLGVAVLGGYMMAGLLPRFGSKKC